MGQAPHGYCIDPARRRPGDGIVRICGGHASASEPFELADNGRFQA